VEGQLGATAAHAIAERGRHRGLLPVERVGQHRRLASGRPAAADVRGQAERGLVEEDQAGSAPLGVCLVAGQRFLTHRSIAFCRIRRRDAWAAARSTPADGAAAPTPRRDDGGPRSARSPTRSAPGSTAPRRTPEPWRLPPGPARPERAGHTTAWALGRSARGCAVPWRRSPSSGACQTLTAWPETPSWRATSPGGRRRRTARRRTAGARGAGQVLVWPQGGEGQLAYPDPRLLGSRAPTRPSPPQPDTQPR
jgi:hypothetical protein